MPESVDHSYAASSACAGLNSGEESSLDPGSAVQRGSAVGLSTAASSARAGGAGLINSGEESSFEPRSAVP